MFHAKLCYIMIHCAKAKMLFPFWSIIASNMQSCNQHIRDLHITYRVKIVYYLYVEYSCRVNSNWICEGYIFWLYVSVFSVRLPWIPGWIPQNVVSVCAPLNAWVHSASNVWPSELEYLFVGQDFRQFSSWISTKSFFNHLSEDIESGFQIAIGVRSFVLDQV